MELVTQTALAKRIGISRQAIAGAIKRNKLRVTEGKIDLHDVLTVSYMKDNSSSRQVAKQNKQESVDSGSVKKTGPTIQTDSEPESDESTGRGGESSIIRDRKLSAQVRKLDIEMAERLGDLIPKKEVEKVFNRLSIALVNYIFPIGERLSPIVAGAFKTTDQEKINKVRKILDTEIERALESVKREIAESLGE